MTQRRQPTRRSGYTTRRSYTTRRTTRRTSRKILETRAPRRGTIIIASILYISGLFGYLWFSFSAELSIGLLALAGGLLLLGSLLRDL
ncbi:MAG: hypothetical protein JW900_15150 [Anaerolineae bacterium]|nr:hypothetical protein [Anaerolineae bacterium]